MIAQIKIQDDEIFPDGEWRTIAHEKDKRWVNDDEIYHYMENDFDMLALKEGDIIQLDEDFEVMEIGEIQ